MLGIFGLLAGRSCRVALAFFALSIAPIGIVDLPLLGAPLDFLRGADGLAAHLTALFFVSAAFYVSASGSAALGPRPLALLALVLSLGTAVERPCC